MERNCLTCKWEPEWEEHESGEWGRSHNGLCRVPLPCWIINGEFDCPDPTCGFSFKGGAGYDPVIRRYDYKEEKSFCAYLAGGWGHVPDCPAWQAKEANNGR